jgi:hypothetical protein
MPSALETGHESGLTETAGSLWLERRHLGRMREGTTVEVSAANRARLEAVVADRNSPRSMSGERRSSWPRPTGWA